jgi:glyoxylase-like metal-dependent hydrolase (beta-lactamase superfamily II)
MKIEQLYTKCLSEATYYIESNGEAAIIDPLRDVDVYVDMAKKEGVKIKYIFETHFHADFVSGHLDLARRTGASIIYGPNAEATFDFHKGQDGELFQLGDISITLLHTPGHTMESSCFLLKDEENKNHCVFTGDTLFVGDVGRPDLAVKAGHITQEDLAGYLFDSIHTKLMPLEDDVIVFPSGFIFI